MRADAALRRGAGGLGLTLALAFAVALVGLGCRSPAHIDLSLRTDDCETLFGNPKPPASCAGMMLDCATFVEVRVYESDARGTLGSILGSNCLPREALGEPANLCALQKGHAPFSLLKELPAGKTVRFRMRALATNDLTAACNVDLPGHSAPMLVFDGFSPPLTLDGEDHRVVIQLDVCGSCDNVGIMGCDPPNPPPDPPPDCPRPDQPCSGGRAPLYQPGACCGICGPP